MRIPSIKKVELQALAYSKAHPVAYLISAERKAEFDKVRKEYTRLRKMSDHERNGCPADKGGICTCDQKPILGELNKLMEPLVKILNDFYDEEVKLQGEVYLGFRKMMFAAREAKIKYRARKRTPQ